MKIIFSGFLFLIVCISVYSCEKERIHPVHQWPTGSQKSCSLDKIFHGDSSHYSQYIYNDMYRVDSIKTYSQNILTGFAKYHYNIKKTLDKIEYFENGLLKSYMTVFYRSNQAVGSYRFYEVAGDTVRQIRRIGYYYDENGRLKSNKFSEPGADGKLEDKYELRYVYDLNKYGNISRAEEFTKYDSIYKLTGAINYETNNIMVDSRLSPIITNGHFYYNIVRETKTDLNEKVVFSIINSYEVDQNQRVKSKISTYSTDTGTAITKEFYNYRCVPI